jgi:hypothetical protein
LIAVVSRETKNIFIVAGLILLIVLIIVILDLIFSAKKPKAGLYDDFAKCLADKKITMYGSVSCPWCQKEKSNFGESFKYVPYVECSIEPQKCLAMNIESIPTWVFPDGQRLVGYQSLEKLSQASGCPLPNQ